MNRLRIWLGAEVTRVRIFEREVAVKRVHLTTLLLAALVALVVGLVLGFAAGYTYPYRTLPRPKIPSTETVPHCGSNPKQHQLGSCLPQPTSQNAASIFSTKQGPDLSNNNPVYAGQGAIAAHNAYEIDKVTEGTGYADPTARPMVLAARAHHLVVGGYDFLHVCLVSPIAEANFFVVHLRADRLVGRGTLPPVGDAEYGGAGCDVRTWLTSWSNAVYAAVHRHPTFYTGAWWWNPHVGAWWPSPALAWVSGYTGSLSSVPRPGNHARIDLWQFTDHGWNGATSSDLSVWLDGAAAFRRASSTAPPRLVCFGPHARVRNATCRTVDAKAAKQANAIRNSTKVYTHRHCDVLAQRDAYFARKLRRYPNGARAPHRRAALGATRRAERRRSCRVFRRRIAYFTSARSKLVAHYS